MAPQIDHNYCHSVEAQDESFLFQRVELLLDEASDLLDRAYRTRFEYNDLMSKAFVQGLDLIDYYEKDLIQQDEIAAGYFELPYASSSAEQASQKTLRDGYKVASEFLNQLYLDKMGGPTVERQNLLIAKTSELAMKATFDEDVVAKHYLQDNWQADFPNDPAYASAKTRPELEKGAVAEVSLYNLQLQVANTLSRLQAQQALADAAVQRQSGLDYRASYDQKDIEFRRRRMVATKQIGDARMIAAADPQGVLNYFARATPLAARFRRDLRDAIARIWAARIGLRLIYGCNQFIPETVFSEEQHNTVNDGTFESILDSSVLFVRNSVAWITRFSQLDQVVVVPISLRKLCGRNFNDFRDEGIWEFVLSEEDFEGMRHVRLRGASVFVMGGRSENVWRGRFNCPSDSHCRHLDGQRSQLDQTKIPPIRFGRATRREAIRDPDILGAAAMRNVSPFGAWSLRVEEVSLFGDLRQRIEDVHIDLHMVFRSTD